MQNGEINLNNNPLMKVFTDYQAKAEQTLQHPDLIEKLLRDAEAKLAVIPKIGEHLSNIPLLLSLIRSYNRKEYTQIPLKSVAAIVAAIAYLVNPKDVIPDFIPGIGHIDDKAILDFCHKMVRSDLDAYRDWRQKHSN
ncbi:MAG: YkvA family protein [bacterium]